MSFAANLYANILLAHELLPCRAVDLPGNALEGELPDLSRLSTLRRLSLPLNSITGHFPNILSISNISYVDLSVNSLKGPLPDWIGSMSSLRCA